MDLSAVIFVVLALAWAVYLIPKALAHHDEVAGERLEEGHSEKVRVLTRRRTPLAEPVLDEAAPAQTVTETEVEVEVTDTVVRRAAPALSPTARAARNRRRVLGGLLTVLLVVAALAGFAVLPWWSVAVPATLVVAFLVVARVSVRKAQQARRSAPRTAVPVEPHRSSQPHPTVEPVQTHAAAPVTTSHDALGLLADPTTTPAQQADLEVALADEGSLWDPLPLTLPTYVGKATARRTVRTIELTGMTSSGHDEGDTALARQADEDAERASSDTVDRKVAGA